MKALDELTANLRREFAATAPPRGRAPGGRIAELLGTYSRNHEDWRPWTFFDEAGYTRNLVVREEAFELLILGWGAGQESPIHNHEGQDCWMVVLEGEVEEVRYATPPLAGSEGVGSEGDGSKGPEAPTPRESKVFSAAQVAYIHDDIGLHLVRPAPLDRTAVSLHLYAAPYDACNVYCPETGRITRKTFTNHSVRGKLLVQERC